MFLLVGLSTSLVLAQNPRGPAPRQAAPRTALEALELARSQTKKSIKKLVAVLGSDGSPTPRAWSFLFQDPDSPTSLSYLAPGAGPEPADEAYAKGESPKFFDASRVNLDSTAAFEAANRQASEAKVGFDRLNYELRGMEFTGEPIWTLRLLDAEEHIVGIIHLSAETGKIKRTIWLRRTARQGVRVIDSSLAGGVAAAAGESPDPDEEPELRALPPVRNIEPPPPPDATPKPDGE